LATNEKIDLVLLTHVDDDHIGGLLKAFEYPDYLPKITKKSVIQLRAAYLRVF
jgi:beta-lactamase superfamily II metal-dependent hydrolase